ncbi:MAG: cytochrome-c oxidase, cbb3-type subunit II [Proteobacteria bacterium]|nr:cytochrome-c oxidase, cbb3-type subunit II [Pseudomonadota bacterium]
MADNPGNSNPHAKLERNAFIFIVFMVIVSSIGAIVEIFPLFKKEVVMEHVEGMRPHTPLELLGMEIYKKEGCYGCHSQQIRVLKDEVERYGHHSLAVESMYDHPFLWGSKRTGPDLARIGEKYSDDWHIAHIINPRSVVPQSIMSRYPHIANEALDTSSILNHMSALRFLGIPYTDHDIEFATEDIKIQLGILADEEKVESFKTRYQGAIIRKFHKTTKEITSMDALIGYLQSLGNKVNLETNTGRSW